MKDFSLPETQSEWHGMFAMMKECGIAAIITTASMIKAIKVQFDQASNNL